MLLLQAAGFSAADVDNSLYRVQMGKYRNLNERYHQQKLKVAQLRKKNKVLQKKYNFLQKKAGKIKKMIDKQELKKQKAVDNIAMYQEHFKNYENLAAQKEKKYWRTQENYGHHQKEYGEIRVKKLKAYEDTKKNMDLEIKLNKKTVHLQEKHQGVLRAMKQVQKDMIQMKKEYDKMVNPIEGF